MHEYSSSRQSSDIIFENQKVQKNIPDPGLVTHSSIKRQRTNLCAKTKQTGSFRGCRVCGKSVDRCYWIGCQLHSCGSCISKCINYRKDPFLSFGILQFDTSLYNFSSSHAIKKGSESAPILLEL